MILLGLALATSFFILAYKLGIGKVLHYQVAADILVTCTCAWLLSGSHAGMAAGIFGGLFFSGMLLVASHYFHTETPQWYQPHGTKRWWSKRVRWVKPAAAKTREPRSQRHKKASVTQTSKYTY